MPPIAKRENVMSAEIALDPIVVIGAPRSGTTYLQAVLNQHPDIFISRETRIFAWAHQVAEVLPGDPRFVHGTRDAFDESIIPWTQQFIYQMYRKLCKGAYFWGDKYPNYAAKPEILSFIVRLFAGARFVHLVRDGRDVVASLLKKEWTKTFEGAHTAWANSVRNASQFGETLPTGQYVELRYEELVHDGPAVVASLLDFLGVPAHDAVTEYLRRQALERTPLSKPTRSATMLNAGASQWEELLTPEQRERSLALLEPYLSRLGYVDASSEGGYAGAAPQTDLEAPTAG